MDKYFANFDVSCGTSYKSNQTSPHNYQLTKKPVFASSPDEAFNAAINRAKDTVKTLGEMSVFPNPKDDSITIKLSSLTTEDGKAIPFNRLEGIVTYKK